MVASRFVAQVANGQRRWRAISLLRFSVPLIRVRKGEWATHMEIIGRWPMVISIDFSPRVVHVDFSPGFRFTMNDDPRL